MDGLSLCAITNELQQLIGGKIDKVQQPERDALLLSVRAQNGTHALYISASAENCRIQCTETKRQNPQEPPMFCMLLRRRLCGGRITEIRQPEMDRCLYIKIDTLDELGEDAGYTLAVEIMSRHSNIILLDRENRIVDAIKRVSPAISAARPILPGMVYTHPPRQNKRDPRLLSAEDFSSILATDSRPRALSAACYGIAPDTAELLFDACGRTDLPLAQALFAVFRDIFSGKTTPCILKNDEDVPIAVLPFYPDAPASHIETQTSMSKALDLYYEKRDEAEHQKRRTASILKILQNNIERVEKKAARHNEALTNGENIQKLRKYGSLLTANLYLCRHAREEITLTDYESDPPQEITIPLDPRFSASENAQRYFKKYQKAKAAQEMAEEMLREAEAELQYLEGQIDNLNKCAGIADLAELREELIAEGYIHPSREELSRKKMRPPKSKPLSYVSSDGIEISVGKNNRQNDLLTLKIAEPDFLWLHAKDMPGSHVIVHTRGEVPSATLREAAMLAAYYSSGRHASNVPVDYVKRKHVKKPAHAKPGMVIYTGQKTVYITPEEAKIKLLKQNI